MYTIKAESEDKSKPVIDRSMSCDAAIELIPVFLEICRVEFNMTNPVALSMGDGVYRLFDIENPSEYVKVSIVKDAN